MSHHASSSRGVYGGGAPADHRRKWDRDEFAQKARDRLAAEKDAEAEAEAKAAGRLPKVKRELLKARDYAVDLESRVGKSVVINKAAPTGATGGYYCDVCDCVVKDSINFLDHINGKNHQRNLGMSMKVKKCTLDDVKKRFELKKHEKEEQKREYSLQERLEEVKEEEQRLAEYRRQKRQDAKRRRKGQPIDDDHEDSTASAMDPDMAAMMGFGGFNTSKKPK